MTDAVKTETVTVAVAPMPVTMIGTRSEGTGSPITSGQVIVTPDHQPNIVVQVVTPIAAILVRFINAYLTILVGLLGAGMTSSAIPAPDFQHLVIKCAGLSLAGAGLGLIKDLVTVFSGLEKKFPLATGSV